MTDLEIINGLKHGNSKAFIFLQQTIGPTIFGFIINRGGTPDDGKTIMQDTFMVLWQKIVEKKFVYQKEGLLRRYVMKITVNLWLKKLKRKKQLNISYVEKSELEYFSDKAVIPSWYDKTEDNLMLIHKAIQQLDPSCQQLIKYYYSNDAKLQDIAEDLGIKYTTLKMQIHRCREKIKTTIFINNLN